MESEIPILPPGVMNTTLGLLYVGFVFSSVLYGISMLQFFIYTTCQRSSSDHFLTKFFVFILFISDNIIQLLLTWAMYRLLVTDFGNPYALLVRGASSGSHLLNYSGIPSAIIAFIVQLFFVHRIWGFSLSIRSPLKWIFSILTIILSLLSFSTSLAVVIDSLAHDAPRPKPELWRMNLSSTVVTDLTLCICLVIILMRERTGKSSGVNTTLNYLMLMSISTGLMTTAFALASLITYFTSTATTWYIALGFISNKLYVNSALAALNSREHLRDILVRSSGPISMPDFKTRMTSSNGMTLSNTADGEQQEARSIKSIKSVRELKDKDEASSLQVLHSQMWSQGTQGSGSVNH